MFFFSPKGSTPLFVACQAGHLEVVRVLLRAYANPEAQMDQGGMKKRPIDAAREGGFKEIEKYLQNNVPDAGEYPDLVEDS